MKLKKRPIPPLTRRPELMASFSLVKHGVTFVRAALVAHAALAIIGPSEAALKKGGGCQCRGSGERWSSQTMPGAYNIKIEPLTFNSKGTDCLLKSG